MWNTANAEYTTRANAGIYRLSVKWRNSTIQCALHRLPLPREEALFAGE